MEAQQQGQEETIGWEYGTNATHHIRVLRENGQWRPTKDTITPDGSIYDPQDSLTLVIEVSNGQAMSDARAKIVKTMKMNTVVGGIILNFNESPAYSHPKPAEWNPRDEHTFMLAKEFGQQPHERWGPMTVQGYQFGGSIEGSMEVIQRDKAPVYAVSDELEILTLHSDYCLLQQIIPTASDADRQRLDKALNSLWKAVVAAHTDKPCKELKSFSVENLCNRLLIGRIKTNHDRYHRAWATRRKRKQPLQFDADVDTSNNKRSIPK